MYSHGVYSRTVSSKLEVKPPKPMHGTCRMCGAHDRDLRMMAVGDYIDWTCAECIHQLAYDQGLKLAFFEQTEPAE